VLSVGTTQRVIKGETARRHVSRIPSHITSYRYLEPTFAKVDKWLIKSNLVTDG